MLQPLCFNDFTFSPVTRDSQPWFKSSELARALGYANDNYVTRLYRRNEDEFSSDMTQLIENSAEIQFGSEGRSRIFSLRGCHLLAMFARTPVAKAFRRWVLDVIEQYGDRVPVAHPVTLNDAPISPEQRAELKLIVDSKAGMVPKAVQRRAYKEIWTRFNRHFHIAEYKQLPCSRMDEARDFLLSMQVNAGKAEALPQASLVMPRPGYATIDERPYLELIDAIQAAHEEVERALSPIRNRIYDLCDNLAWIINERSGISVYGVNGMDSMNSLRGYLCHAVNMETRKAMISPDIQLNQYTNPAYSLLGIVRQLNAR
ncbi:BRO family protein [Bilophila wadsworthia]|uniref:BRO family protein n=1 Tax=Bilophila wadsworthia TaxID=35833 RepID=UPI0032200CDD